MTIFLIVLYAAICLFVALMSAAMAVDSFRDRNYFSFTLELALFVIVSAILAKLMWV